MVEEYFISIVAFTSDPENLTSSFKATVYDNELKLYKIWQADAMVAT